MSITQEQARVALYSLSEARDMALLYGVHGGGFSGQNLLRHLNDAATFLGYTLTPIVTPSPDSGRASADIFQNNEA